MKILKETMRLAGAISLAGAAMLVAGTPASADDEDAIEYGPIELKHLENGSEALSADRGYIFMSGPVRLTGRFIRTPDAEDLADYEAEWREELAEARERYPRQLSRYEDRVARARRTGDDRGLDKPVEPTEENFSIGAIEMRHMLSIGPQYVFDKGRDENGDRFYHYLQAVRPGTYTYYGPIAFTGQAYAGMCYCMGTVRFEVKAGEVTSIGDLMLERWADNEAMAQASVFFEPEEGRVAEAIDFAVPASISGLPVVEADFRAAGKINNFYKLGVRRLPPMEGVLRYDRGEVIDVKGEAELARAQAEAEAAARAEAIAAAAQAGAAARAAASSDNESGAIASSVSDD
ncbi:hypothetical protein [Qipengyuania nanhaisediminis]|uniref:hypothetical protein n=1 Tax=Qipengyuania nanhaisediminis TaxID=604088 RepID=UPI0038B33413